MNEVLRGPRGIFIILAIIIVIAVALLVRSFILGDTDNDEDEAFTGTVVAVHVV